MHVSDTAEYKILSAKSSLQLPKHDTEKAQRYHIIVDIECIR